MKLREAFGISGGEVVAFVGAGGKTTALFRLARELAQEGGKVIVTTTTKIYPPGPQDSDLVLIRSTLEEALKELGRQSGLSIVTVASALLPEGKLKGVEVDWVARLQEVVGVDYLLVEADGAARKPLTAPRSYEPVIPSSTSLVVPMVGAEVVGLPLNDRNVHRPERVAALASIVFGEPVTAEVVATVMLHPEGNTKGAPKGARILPFVNKADSPERLAKARAIGRCLLERGCGHVILGAVCSEPPVVEVMSAATALC